MPSPASNKPKITNNAITDGFVTRYFVKHVSKNNVVEVDPIQYREFAKSPYYETLSLNWVIGGNATDLTGNHGVVIRGAEYQNTKIAQHYDAKMRGIAQHLRNPLEFFSGTRLKDQPRVIKPSQTYGTSTITTLTATLNRTTSGRLFSKAASPIAVSGVETNFLQADWTSMGDAAVIGLETVGNGGYLTLIATGPTPGTRTFYNNVVSDRVDGMMFTRVIVWSRTNQILSLPMMRVDTPAAQFPTRAIYARHRDATVNSFELYEHSSDITVQSSSLALATPEPTTTGLRAKGSDATAWSSTGNTTRTLTGVAMQTAGKFAVGVQNFSAFASSIFYSLNRVVIHADDTLTVQGNIGIRASILDASGTVLATVDAPDGNASINLWNIRQTYCPEGLPLATKLQVFDLDTLTLRKEVEPTERLWGGDVWEFTLGA